MYDERGYKFNKKDKTKAKIYRDSEIMEKRFIAYIVAILAILGLVFLGQQAYFQQLLSGDAISNVADKASAYLAKGSSWLAENVYYPKIRVGVQSGGDMIQSGINQGMQNISGVAKNISEKIENYFSGIKNSILNPEAPQNCQMPTDQ